MSRLAPEQEWWTAAEIAAAALPDMPSTKRGMNELIDRLKWRSQPAHARRRVGRGGGWEYSWRLFPSRAQRHLLGATAPKVNDRPGRDEAWRWFDGLPEKVKTQARHRLGAIQRVEALEPAVGGRHLAVLMIGKSEEVAPRTIWNWFAAIEGVRVDDRLPYLAPRHRAVVKVDAKKDCSPEFFDVIRSDYLRLEAPPFTDCYRRALRVAKAKGWDTLPERTMRRRLDETVSEPMQVLARKGVDAVKRMFPPQVRDKSCLVAMESVNADFHKFDVFVKWPAPKGEPPTIMRPQMVAFQDIYSGRILAWRLDVSANSTAVMLAAGEMIETWGIPQHVLLDNGREFAAKAITGGTATRFRFKVKEDDLPGLFTGLGCTIHWATPYSGQSKPIERAFRDMCQSIAKDPRFAGAYTGNRPDAKPENYGSKAVELEDFLTLPGGVMFDDLGMIDDVTNLDYAGGVTPTGTYTFAAGIDLGTVRNLRLRSDIGMGAFQAFAIWDDRAGDIDSWGDIDGVDGAEVDVVMEYRETDDDPAGAPVWSPWSRVDSSEVRARAVQARAILSTNDAAFTVRVDRLRLYADEVI